MSARVFISHAVKDRPLVDPLKTAESSSPGRSDAQSSSAESTTWPHSGASKGATHLVLAA